MPWYTDEQILAIPAFAGLTADRIPQLAADAGALYGHISAVPGISDADLRSWAEGAGMTPDRYNLAAQALSQSGKGVQIGSGPLVPIAPLPLPTPPTPAPVPTPAPAALGELTAGSSVPTEVLTEAELRRVAKRLDLTAPQSATKADLAEAISRAQPARVASV